jgi:ubiquinone/menaquinone biosynthesis C-methylase UbiE
MEGKDRVRHPLQSNPLHRYMYRYFTRRLSPDWSFLNVGYEEDPPMALPLEVSDEPDRSYIQLYHRTATQADLSGKEVLEVGCGHGGGASYLVRTLHPVSYTGLDLNSAGIAFCRKRHNLAGLEFVEGDAENLPFPDQSFDAVINIESSVHYPRFPRFLTEVARVLRPGGHFLYADFRTRGGIAAWDAALTSAPMRMLSSRVINAEVVRAMEKNSRQRLDRIERCMPAFLRPLTRGFIRAQDSRGVDAIQSGRIPYRMYCFTKV